MTRIAGPVVQHKIEWGYLRAPAHGSDQVIGDRLVPSPIEVDFPGSDGQPALAMMIEVIDGVPRCTELTFRRTDGGREIRERDLRAVELDEWIEAFVSIVSAEIIENDNGRIAAVDNTDVASFRAGMKTIRNVRKGSRRAMTDQRKQRVAAVYNAQEQGGIEAVEAAFGVSRSTAVRYIKAARDAGLIEKRA